MTLFLVLNFRSNRAAHRCAFIPGAGGCQASKILCRFGRQKSKIVVFSPVSVLRPLLVQVNARLEEWPNRFYDKTNRIYSNERLSIFLRTNFVPLPLLISSKQHCNTAAVRPCTKQQPLGIFHSFYFNDAAVVLLFFFFLSIFFVYEGVDPQYSNDIKFIKSMRTHTTDIV